MAITRRKEAFQLNPQIVFLTLGVFFGVLVLLAAPPGQVADEYQHFYHAYAISDGILSGSHGTIPGSVRSLFDETKALPFNPSAQIKFASLTGYLSVPLGLSQQVPVDFLNTSVYSPIAYIPQVVGIEMGKLLQLNPLVFFYLGRFFALAAWLGLGFLALRLAPGFKWALVLFFLTPMSLQQAASYSADSMTNALAFVWIATCLYLGREKDQPISKAFLMLVFSLAALIPLTKQPYTFLLALWFIVPTRRFGSRRRYLAATTGLVLVGFIFFLWSSFIGKDVYGSVRPDIVTSIPDQLRVILNGPFGFLETLIRTLWVDRVGVIEMYIGRLGWLDTTLPPFIYRLFLAAAVLVSLFDHTELIWLSLKQKMVVAATVTLFTFVSMTALYLTWTPVGNPTVDGVQGRYFISIVPVLALILYNRKLPTSQKWLGIATTLALSIILGFSVHTLILRYFMGA